jgi:hypothetical protein
VYVGQIVGPFMIPCHLHYKGRTVEQIKAVAPEVPQCGGAAVMRANIQIDHQMPRELLRLPADHSLVFSNLAEFLAHHKRISLFSAARELMVTPPHEHLRRQLERPTTVKVTMP